jgi:hypothetical protein
MAGILEGLKMTETEKKLIQGFLDANWKDFIKYIDEQMEDPLAEEVSNVYNSIMSKLSSTS